MMGRLLDLTGRRFDRLVVIERAPNVGTVTRWLTQCDCGADPKPVAAQSLVEGVTRSCGCLKGELVAARNVATASRGGQSKMPEYDIWKQILARCTDEEHPAYESYGGRGIMVADRWQSFDAFLEDMGPRPTSRHTVEREENDLGYGPDNCVWATYSVQANNRRNNVRVTWNGVTLTVAQWAEVAGMTYVPMRERVKRGWPMEAALTLGILRTGERRDGRTGDATRARELLEGWLAQRAKKIGEAAA